jgi:tRNA 2-thiouridine synthesizing protein A
LTYPQIDARGRSCPEPVLLTKKGLEKDSAGLVVLVDNTTARDNVTRFARNAGYQVKTEQDGTDYRMIISR